MDEQDMSIMVGGRIREERERAGKRLEDLAADIGISESHLSRIERGQRGLDSLMLRKIAAELKVSMERFLVPSSYEFVHARSGERSWAGMAQMIEWGRKVQDDLGFVIREGGKNVG